jgi:hypothetical protein
MMKFRYFSVKSGLKMGVVGQAAEARDLGAASRVGSAGGRPCGAALSTAN